MTWNFKETFEASKSTLKNTVLWTCFEENLWLKTHENCRFPVFQLLVCNITHSIMASLNPFRNLTWSILTTFTKVHCHTIGIKGLLKFEKYLKIAVFWILFRNKWLHQEFIWPSDLAQTCPNKFHSLGQNLKSKATTTAMNHCQLGTTQFNFAAPQAQKNLSIKI